MTSHSPSRRARGPVVAAAAVAVGSLALGTAATAAPAPVQAARTSPSGRVGPAVAVVPQNVWQRISGGGGLSGIDQPSLLRRNKLLYVAWHRQDAPNSESVRTRLINPAGQLGIPGVAVGNWAGIVHDPMLVDTTAKPLVVYGGQRTTNVGEDFAGQMAASDSATPGTWTFDPYSFSQSQYAYGSYGTAATTFEGDQINAFALNSDITFHEGSDPMYPAASADIVLHEPSSVSTYDTSMVTDPKTGKVWVAWFDLSSSVPSLNGIRYATLLPTLSAGTTVPGSHDASGSAIQPDQRVALATGVSGTWVAFTTGYPTGKGIVLYNLETHRALTVPGSANSDQVGLASGPGGRLWVYWSTSENNLVHAVQTNGAVTRFEAVQTVRSPDIVSATAGEGTLGPLDLVINSAVRSGSNDNELFYRRFLARFAVGASYRKGVVTVSVTDAGSPVAGAVVRFGTVVAKTAANGRVALKVGTKKGVRTFGIGANGYWSAVLRVKV